MKPLIFLTILCALTSHILTKPINLIRETKYGLISGAVIKSRANPEVEFYSFKGVPYARPPVGDLRFQEPQAPKRWFGIQSATEPPARCTQISENFNGNRVVGSEDCLYLEISEPITGRKNDEDLLPVMVWIHGGTFIFGSANNTQADYLMEKPVIIVSVQYRLNVFGFLSLLDDHAKGNAGLKDQQFALRWVQENIQNFGGDPDKVTIFGESAGGASVQYHILSKTSQGLFHQAISHSGSALNRWALQENPLNNTNKLAKGLGITTNSAPLLLKKLQEVDKETLLFAAFNQSIMGFYTPYYAQPFAPIVEKESASAVLTDSPFSLLQAGQYAKVPYIMGFNSEEGSFGYDYIANGRVDINIYEENPGLLIPISLKINKKSHCYDHVIEEIKRFYFKSDSVTDQKNWIDYMSQELFNRGIMKALQLTFREMPVYLYRFSYAGSRQVSYFGGVGHFEELRYLFYPQNGIWDPQETESDELTRKRFVEMWTNFAQTGEPTPDGSELLQNVDWSLAYPNKVFLDIGTDLAISENLNHNHTVFWEEIFGVCGYPPYTTY